MTVPPPETFNPWYPGAVINSEATMSRLQELENEIEEEAARLRELFPSLRTTVRVELGDPVEALAEGSASAQLTVVRSEERRVGKEGDTRGGAEGGDK